MYIYMILFILFHFISQSLLRGFMSPGAVLPHRQCGTDFCQRDQSQSKTTMASLRDFETEYLSSDPEVFVGKLQLLYTPSAPDN